MSRDFRSGDTLWKVLRVGAAFDNDPNWIGDVSNGVPPDEICASAHFEFRGNRGKNTQIEFVVIPYVASTGVVVDRGAETFAWRPIYVHDTSVRNRPRGSAVTGNGVTEQIATEGANNTGALFCQHYRFPCDGADKFTIRITTFSGTPSDATAWEIWYRPVVA